MKIACTEGIEARASDELGARCVYAEDKEERGGKCFTVVQNCLTKPVFNNEPNTGYGLFNPKPELQSPNERSLDVYR